MRPSRSTPARPERGFVFDGRIAEDFKLSTGTFVSVGPLRAAIIAAGDPLVQDVVLTGINRDEVGALFFPRLDACRAFTGMPSNAPAHIVLGDPTLRAFFQRLVDTLHSRGTGSANRVARALVLAEPPSIDRGEITDKGSINQRAVLTHRDSRRRPSAPWPRPRRAAPPDMKSTHFAVTVQFGDCDPAGIVFYPNFLRWMDAASLSFFMQCGVPPWRELVKTRGIVGTPLLEIATRFVTAATYAETLDIETSVQEWRAKVFVQKHSVTRAGTLICEGTETRAFVRRDDDNADRLRAMPIPDDIRALCS